MSSLIPIQPFHNTRRIPKNGAGLKYIATFAMAAIADGVQIAFPPLWMPVSIITALILFALWGWRWEILCVMIPELAPVVGIFPSWLALSIYLTNRDTRGRKDSRIRVF